MSESRQYFVENWRYDKLLLCEAYVRVDRKKTRCILGGMNLPFGGDFPPHHKLQLPAEFEVDETEANLRLTHVSVTLMSRMTSLQTLRVLGRI